MCYFRPEQLLPSLESEDGRDRMNCRGYRHVSVLNTDYKLCYFLRGMEAARSLLVDEDQTELRGKKNRLTQENIRSIIGLFSPDSENTTLKFSLFYQ